MAKRSRMGGAALIIFLIGSWWGAHAFPPQDRAEAVADIRDARRFMETHLSEEARAFIVPKLDDVIDGDER